MSTPSTARTMRPLTLRCTLTSRVASSGSEAISVLQLRRRGGGAGVEHLVQPVGEQVEAEHRERDGGAGEHAHPPGVVEELLAAVQHLTPARHRRIAEAEE